MKIHHIGYAVKDVSISMKSFEKLGYVPKGILFDDEIRNVKIQFMQSGDYLIELVSPLDDKSPVKNILKKISNTCYHICYETYDMGKEIENLTSEGYILVESPLEAIAIEKKQAAFLFGKDIGLIEIVASV